MDDEVVCPFFFLFLLLFPFIFNLLCFSVVCACCTLRSFSNRIHPTVAPLSPTIVGGFPFDAFGFVILLPPPAKPLRFLRYIFDPRAAPPTFVYKGAGRPQSRTLPRNSRLVKVSDLFVSSSMEPILYP